MIKAATCALTMLFAAEAHAGVVFTESFSSMTLGQSDTFAPNVNNCPAHLYTADPQNTTTSMGGTTSKWTFFPSSYPQTWYGTNATQAWSTHGTYCAYLGLCTRAEITVSGPNRWDGWALISRATFDQSKYLSATADMSMDYCGNGAGNGAGCFAGLTLLASEADYREIAYSAFIDPNTLETKVKIGRWAPCDFSYFMELVNGNWVDVERPLGVLRRFRIDYLGPEGGGWRYFVDGVQQTLRLCTSQTSCILTKTEPGTFLNAAFAAGPAGAPHVGMYWIGSGNNNYVEGHVQSLSVQQLQKVTPSGASAGSSYAGYPASYAIDGNSGSSWNAGGVPTRWIELDLGSSKSIRKIRLLTNQDISGSTTHQVLVGSSPAPQSVIKTFSGSTSDSVWLEVDTSVAPVTGRYVRVKTTASPTWVSWREIEVYE